MERTIASVGAMVLIGAVAWAQDSAPPQPVTPSAMAQREMVEVKAQAAQAVRVPLEASVIKGAPYSAEVVTESVQVLGDGNRIVRRTTGRVYRDSQGRTRREQDLEPGHVGTISISDPVAKVSYSLDADRKIGWKSGTAIGWAIAGAIAQTPADPVALDRRKLIEAEIAGARGGMVSVSPVDVPPPPPPPPGIKPAVASEGRMEKLPARNIEGVMAEGVRTTRTIRAGAIGNEQPIVTVTEEWRSPDLQVLVLTRTSDPRTGESTYKLLNITRAEPAQSWFEVPPDYQIKESGIKKVAPVMK